MSTPEGGDAWQESAAAERDGQQQLQRERGCISSSRVRGVLAAPERMGHQQVEGVVINSKEGKGCPLMCSDVLRCAQIDEH